MNKQYISDHFENTSFKNTKGIEKRVMLVKKYVDLNMKNILDLGCGVGGFTIEFSKYAKRVVGIDVEEKAIKTAKNNIRGISNIEVRLFDLQKDDLKEKFDIVFMNEVIEHLENESSVLRRVNKLLNNNGVLVIFAPNKGFPFETHGLCFGKKSYNFNVPLLSWFPEFIRKPFTNARIYSARSLKRTLIQSGFVIEKVDYIMPTFAKIEKKTGFLGRIIRGIFWKLEKTPLKIFGLSIFIIAKK